MNFVKTLKKAFLGFLTFATAYVGTNPEAIVNLVPEEIATMTVGGAITAGIVGLTNWLKHRNK